MLPEQKKRLRDVCRMIRSDCEADVNEREGQPLTGPNVAKWLGEMQAQTSALASVLLTILEDDDD